MQKGDQTREMIIEKAAKLFNRNGYDGCSLSDIMSATNLQKGGIYNHFRNKDEIALEAFDYSYGKLIQKYRNATHGVTSPRAKIEKILDMFSEYYLNPAVEGGCPIANTAVYSADTHPELRKKVSDAVKVLEDYITIKIDDGIALGEFNKGLDSRSVAAFIISSFEGSIILSRVQKNDHFLKNSVAQMKIYIDQYLSVKGK